MSERMQHDPTCGSKLSGPAKDGVQARLPAARSIIRSPSEGGERVALMGERGRGCWASGWASPPGHGVPTANRGGPDGTTRGPRTATAAANHTPADRSPQLPPARPNAPRHRRVPGTVDRRHVRPGRDRLVRFRYTTGEYTTVSDAAHLAGYTVSGYVAEVALAAAGERDEVRPAAGVDRELLVALNRAREQVARIGVNLNQAVARFHATGEPPPWLDRVTMLCGRVVARLDDTAAEIGAGLAQQPRRTRRGRRAA